MDSEFSEKLLGRVAYKTYPRPTLERFALTQLGIKSAEYYMLVQDAGEDSWRQCFYVLRAWYRQESRTLRDFSILLGEAERLGFVQRGTHDDVISGRAMGPSYQLKGHSGPYPDFAALVAPWYTDIIFENMLLFPWMDEDALLLSEVYTALDMETIIGRGETRRLKDYRDLFKNVKPEGTRILVKGDPGIGKTTFTHKVAFDSATGGLDMFDVVFVLKLRSAGCDQPIESIIREQINSVKDSNVTDVLVGQYLKSGKDRILLVLDGVDEINLKKYPYVRSVLQGELYRKCCILATARPHVTKTLKRFMTSVAELKGFSRRKAEEFISHIIPDAHKRRRFFGQLDRRKMSRMQRVPLICQALALLFNDDENNELPETFTITYDKLVFFLRRTCESSQGLGEVEIKAAMREVDELAFRGLTRDDRQLVFSRDEVKDANVFKLGLLSGENTGGGFKPSTVLQFPHKTVQENCAANFIARRLEVNDRGPWEAVVAQFHAVFTLAEDSAGVTSSDDVEMTSPGENSTQTTQSDVDDELTQTRILGRAVQKYWSALSSHKNRNWAIIDMLQNLRRIGAFDEEIDVTGMWDEFSNYPMVDENLTFEEKEALADFMGELIDDTTPEWRAVQKEWVDNMTVEHSESLTTYFLGVQMVVDWIQKNPDMAKQKLREMAATFTSQRNLPTQSVSQDFTQIWESISGFEILFRFILGKLSRELGTKILLEIAVMAVQHSFDEVNCGVLPFKLLQSLAEDLMRENGLEQPEEVERLAHPVLVHHGNEEQAPLNCETIEYSRTGSGLIAHAALKVSGTDIDLKKMDKFLHKVNEQLNRWPNFEIAEIEDIKLGHVVPSCGDSFITALYRSPIVSLEVGNTDGYLTNYLTNRLPDSVRRLSISRVFPSNEHSFPPEVSLSCLYLENCSANFANSHFGNLRKLSVISSQRWHQGVTINQREVLTLHKAVTSQRMPKIQELYIRFASMSGRGQEAAQILSHPTLKTGALIGVGLLPEDGEVLLSYIRSGKLSHLDLLDLQDNQHLGLVTDELKAACNLGNIQLKISPYLGNDIFGAMMSVINPPKHPVGGATGTSSTTSRGGSDPIGCLISGFLNNAQSTNSGNASPLGPLFAGLGGNTQGTTTTQSNPLQALLGGLAGNLATPQASTQQNPNPIGSLLTGLAGNAPSQNPMGSLLAGLASNIGSTQPSSGQNSNPLGSLLAGLAGGPGGPGGPRGPGPSASQDHYLYKNPGPTQASRAHNSDQNPSAEPKGDVYQEDDLD